MGLEDAIDNLMNIFFGTTFFGQNWLMYMIIILATLMIITRKYSDWMTLSLPVTIGWRYFGVNIPIIFMGISAVLFVLDIMSFKAITGAFDGIREAVTKLPFRRGRTELTLRRAKYKGKYLDIKAEMTKYKLEELERKKLLESKGLLSPRALLTKLQKPKYKLVKLENEP